MKKKQIKRFLDLLESELSGFIGLLLLLIVAGSLTFAGVKIQQAPPSSATVDLSTSLVTAQEATSFTLANGLSANELIFGTVSRTNALKINSANAELEGNYLWASSYLYTLNSAATITIALDPEVPQPTKAYATVAAVAGTTGGSVTANGNSAKVVSSISANFAFNISGSTINLTLDGNVAIRTITAGSPADPTLSSAPTITALFALPTTLNLKVDESSILTLVGNTARNQTIVVDSADVTFFTSAASIATVNSKGVIKANASGNVVITVALKQNSAITASVRVNVEPAVSSKLPAAPPAPTVFQRFLDRFKLPVTAPVQKQEKTTATEPPTISHPESSEESSPAPTLVAAIQTKTTIFFESVKQSFTGFTATIANGIRNLTSGAAAVTQPPSISPVAPTAPAAPAAQPATFGQRVAAAAKNLGSLIRGLFFGGTATLPEGPGAGATPTGTGGPGGGERF